MWLPIAIAVAGIVAIILGHGRTAEAGTGVGLLIVALIVWMVNWLFRLSLQSNRERDEEERARDYFSRHGHWPDEHPEE